MFGAFAFAQVYFAGVIEILRRASRGHGGSGITPGHNFAAMADQALEDERRRREQQRAERELIDLMASGLL